MQGLQRAGRAIDVQIHTECVMRLSHKGWELYALPECDGALCHNKGFSSSSQLRIACTRVYSGRLQHLMLNVCGAVLQVLQ